MAAVERTETLLGRQRMPEADYILRFLMFLNKEEREDFNNFAKGVEFGMKIARGETTQDIQNMDDGKQSEPKLTVQ